MKPVKRILIALSIGVIAILNQAFARDGDGTDAGNGGDEYAKQFISLATDVAESLTQNPLPEVNATELMTAIRATKVNSNEQLTLNGNEVDAINYPGEAPRIVVSRLGWDRMGREPHRRAFLVLHEYLGIMGKDDSRYQISMMLDRAGVCGRTPGIRRYIERSLRKSCFRIINDDLQYVEHMEIMDPACNGFTREDLTGLGGLKAIGIFDTSMNSIEPRAFDLVGETLTSLILGASLVDWSDCSFFASLKNLESIYGGWTNLDFSSGKMFVQKIGSSCFAENRRMQDLRLVVNFQNGFSSAGFLSGMKMHGNLESVSIKGFGLEKIDPKEFSDLPKSTQLILFNNQGVSFSSTYLDELNQAMSRKNCKFDARASEPKYGIVCPK